MTLGLVVYVDGRCCAWWAPDFRPAGVCIAVYQICYTACWSVQVQGLGDGTHQTSALFSHFGHTKCCWVMPGVDLMKNLKGPSVTLFALCFEGALCYLMLSRDQRSLPRVTNVLQIKAVT